MQNKTIKYLDELSVGFWNIHGLFKNIGGFKYNKLKDPYVDSLVRSTHIFGLAETHHLASDIDSLYLQDYVCFNNCAKKYYKTGRPSGGLSVHVKKHLRSGVLKVPTSG